MGFSGYCPPGKDSVAFRRREGQRQACLGAAPPNSAWSSARGWGRVSGSDPPAQMLLFCPRAPHSTQWPPFPAGDPPLYPLWPPAPGPALPHPAGGSLGADTVSRGPHLLTPRGPSPLQLLVVSCDAAAQGPGFRPLPHKRKVCVEGDVIPEIPSGMGAPSKGGEAALVSQFQG